MSAAAVGVDGCPAGWIAVWRRQDGTFEARVFPAFADLAGRFAEAMIAVDMPIGLPDRTTHGGRGPEALVRPLLGERQSSVFSIPSRAAVLAEDAIYDRADAWYARHRRASDVARATSTPPRAISIQAFAIFPKIRELDALLRAEAGLRERVIESHPEVAFWRLNGERAMATPKKVKGKVNPAGMAERVALLGAHSVPPAFVETPPPRGAASDDLLDAAAMLLIAERRLRGEARPFPDPPLRDGCGLPIAIWA
jgi:predicted RNase H-like nuclease